MPRITFLIGNGFDKQLGLDTGYNQFLEWYINQPSENENLQQYKQELSSNRSSPWWSDAESAMGEHVGGFNSKTIDNYYERVRDFKIKLAEYLRMQEEKCDFSDTSIIGNGFNDFLLHFHEDILLQDKVGNLFSKQNDTEYNFINFNYTRTLDELINSSKSMLDRERLYVTKVNPSSTVYGKYGHTIAIHGSLKTAIIMGVNDESQIKCGEELISYKLKRTLIKPAINSALGRAEDKNAVYLITTSNIIALYGLKLGDTDKKWRDLLGEWLKEKNHRIILFGHETVIDANPVIPEDVLNYVDEKQTAFLKKLYKDIDQEGIEELRDKVLIIPKTSFLDSSLIPKKSLTIVR